MFYEQLNNLCRIKGINLSTLVSDLNLSSSNQTKWKNGAVPKSDTIKKIADYFGVTTDYLLGIEKVSETDTKKSSASLSDSELRLLEYFNLLTVPQQFELLGELKEKTKKVDSSKKEAI